MQLAEDHNDANYLIRAYDSHSVQINELQITHSFVLSASSLRENWPVKTLSDLSLETAEWLLQDNPSVVLLGTGPSCVLAPQSIYQFFYSRHIGFECMDNGAACRTFSALTSESRNVTLGILL